MKQINFIGKRRMFGALSVVLVIASLGLIYEKGVKKSVDFAGGSQVTVQFAQAEIDTASVRESVSHVDSNAQIVRNATETGSSFTVKIKNPEVEEGNEDEAASTRRRSLNRAFAELSQEKGSLLQLLQRIDQESLTRALILENPYALNVTDEVIRNTYQNAAEALKSGAESAESVPALATQVSPEHQNQLVAGLELAFPAVNRLTRALLNAQLTKYNPLNRTSDEDYADIASAILDYRAEQNDFVSDMDAVFSKLADLESDQLDQLKSFFATHFRLGNYNVTSNQTFSPSIAAELLTHAWEAIVLAMAGILFYITVRFTFAYAVSSIVALAHDVIIALGAFALFNYELSNPVVAAFLTIVGYSLNDTIVVFDRIRENLAGAKKPDVASVMNQSINETLSRTLVTSLTTFFVVMVIFVGANVTLSDFAFPLLIGIIVGTYSSIFVASPTLLLLHKLYKPIST